MALHDIRRRIRSVENTAKITKAMEVVSATKMRRSQSIALAGRPYALAALDMLKNVSRRSAIRPELLEAPKSETALCVVVTSDRGLAGAFNANVIRRAERWMKEHAGESYRVAGVGKKAASFFSARRIAPAASFTGFGDYISRNETEPFAEFLLRGYVGAEWGRVIVFYTNFRSTLKQEVRAVEVLPIHPETLEEAVRGITPEYGRFAGGGGADGAPRDRYQYEYMFEPSPREVLNRLLPVLFKIQMHHLILESNASEHSARMMAMKNASESAKDLMGELTVRYHHARQAGITSELTEIIAGREAIESA